MFDSVSIVQFIRTLYPNKGFVPLHEPCFGGKETEYTLDCIASTFVSSVGKYVDRFEDMIRDYTGCKYAIATVNGTSALHIALLLAGVKRGDLVITQPLTFIATCNAISYCGAEPVFVDVDANTLGMSAHSLELWLDENVEMMKMSDDSSIAIHKSSGRKISACVPMHTFGHPCRIEKILAVCDKYHIAVVEDSAESIGSYCQGRHTGTFGITGVLSFNGNKTITTGGGGMILTDDDDIGKLAKHITTTAKKPHPWLFEHDMVGYNYRMPNLNAALGCAQMEKLPDILANKRQTAREFAEFFSGIEDVKHIWEPEDTVSNFWLNVILFPDQTGRNEFLEYSNKSGVMTRPAWTLMNELPMFAGSICSDLSVAKDIEQRLVNLPSSVR